MICKEYISENIAQSFQEMDKQNSLLYVQNKASYITFPSAWPKQPYEVKFIQQNIKSINL